VIVYPTNPKRLDSWDILPMLRDLYSRLPETLHLAPWELQHNLWSLGYTDDLAPVANIAAAVEVARTDFDPDERAS
jgi:hypothetical protein